MVDGREVAPLAASRDMYLNAQGEPIKNASVNGALSAAIPGLPAALVHLSEKYGKLPLADSLKPAINLANNGFAVNEHYRRLAKFRQPVLASHEAASSIFLLNGQVPDVGAVIKQADLARTLELLSTQGFDGFYKGEVASQLVSGVQQNGGIWSEKDLANYTVKERAPVVIDYKNIKVTTATLPSSGGLVLSIALNILEQYDLSSMDEATRIHVVVEAMRRAYRDRALYMGDSDFVSVPTTELTKKSYAHTVSANLKLNEATSSQQLTGLNAIEGHDTTHFSVIDEDGNRVAATLSINYPFGSGFVPKGTGVLLNDEMDDFSIKPGTPNVYGLVGGEANSIEPGKRMVLLGILDAEKGNQPESWVSLPRFHHQYLPDVIQYEPNGLSEQVMGRLKSFGHELKTVGRPYGNMQAILRDKASQQTFAASDPRAFGAAKVERKD